MQDFNPRAPCGARRIFSGTLLDKVFISIHAPRAGRDHGKHTSLRPLSISIHAPRAGRDYIDLTTNKKEDQHFNPRAPCGARLLCIGRGDRVDGFQSTRPVRGATDCNNFVTCELDISIHAPRAGRDGAFLAPPYVRIISIHAPRAGRDPFQVFVDPVEVYFNPRAPCGARHPRQDR